MSQGEFEKGDEVVSSSHGRNDTPGKVEGKLTSDQQAVGRQVRASEEEPQYLSAAGRAAARRYTLSALKRR